MAHRLIGELAPSFNLNADVPVCEVPTLGRGPHIPGQDAIGEGRLLPLVPRDTGSDGFYEQFSVGASRRELIGGRTLGYSWMDEFFERNDDWLPAGVVSYMEEDVFLYRDAMIAVTAFDRRDGSMLEARSGSTVMDVLVVVETSTFAPYWSEGPDRQPGSDPTNGGNLLGPLFGTPRFAGARLYPIGRATDWTPSSTPVVSAPVLLTFDPLREYQR